jgi:hypothetical protein
VQAATAFRLSFLGALGGIYFLPLDPWQRLFLAMTVLFLVTSSFTLAKVIRDQQEAALSASASTRHDWKSYWPNTVRSSSARATCFGCVVLGSYWHLTSERSTR